MLVELCSVAERALNYMHTGNASVIATRVMNPLWIGRSIVQDGIPCLNGQMINNNLLFNRVVVSPETWPYDVAKHQPVTSSQRAQVLTYGEAHYKVSLC